MVKINKKNNKAVNENSEESDIEEFKKKIMASVTKSAFKNKSKKVEEPESENDNEEGSDDEVENEESDEEMADNEFINAEVSDDEEGEELDDETADESDDEVAEASDDKDAEDSDDQEDDDDSDDEVHEEPILKKPKLEVTNNAAKKTKKEKSTTIENKQQKIKSTDIFEEDDTLIEFDDLERTVFVGNAHKTTKKSDIESYMSQFGEIEKVSLQHKKVNGQSVAPKFFVVYENKESHAKALKANDLELLGHNIFVATPKGSTLSQFSDNIVCVKNLKMIITEKELVDKFSSCGKVGFVEINYTPLNNKKIKLQNPYAFIYFMENDSVEKALKLHNTEFHNLTLNVYPHKRIDEFARFAVQVSTNIHSKYTAEDFENFFKDCGKISKIDIKNPIKTLVCFENEKCAQNAIKLSGMDLDGNAVFIQPFVPSNSMNYSVWVKNINKGTTEAEIKELFSKCGEILQVGINKNKHNDLLCGILKFRNMKSVSLALKLNRTSFNNSIIYVNKATEPKKQTSNKNEKNSVLTAYEKRMLQKINLKLGISQKKGKRNFSKISKLQR